MSDRSSLGSSLQFAWLLLLISATRILRFDAILLGKDEIWSIWQGSGSLKELLLWNPYDWPPLYYLVLNGWVELVGFHPFVLRSISVLAFLLGMSFFHRVMTRIAGRKSASFSILIYGGISYTIFLSTELRGYALLQLIIPITWLLAEQITVERPKPYWIVAFSLFCAIALYTVYSALPFIGWMVAYVAAKLYVQVPKKLAVLRILFIGFLIVIFILPLIFYIRGVALTHLASGTSNWPLPPVKEFARIYQEWLGYGVWIIPPLMLISLMVVFWRRLHQLNFLLLIFWGFGTFIALYLFNPLLLMFKAKYASWVLIGVAASLGYVHSFYGKNGQRIALVSGLALLLLPVDWQKYNGALTIHLDKNLAWLQQEWTAGDVVLLADDEGCSEHAEVWNQTLRTYFPNGLPVINHINDETRIWYVNYGEVPDSPHWQTLQRDYIERKFVGTPECQFHLYEGPPDKEGLIFENGLRFHGAQIIENGSELADGFLPLFHEGEEIQIRLWLSIDGPLPLDYSIGLFLLDQEGQVIDENHKPTHPSYPISSPWETSRWVPGEYYTVERVLKARYPNTVHRESLTILLAVYYWEEPARRFTAEGTNVLGMLPLFEVDVVAW